MNFIVYFLLISGLSSIIGDPAPLTIRDIKEYIENGNMNFSGKREHNLTLIAGGKLGITLKSIVWKGFYNGKQVAIKITWRQKSFDREIEILKALKAENLYVEQYGIPRVYYHGPFLRKYNAIAMTLLEGNLKDRCRPENGPTSDINILLWFRRAVEILNYLNEKKVVHNDIKPDNIFYHGSEIFISDFDGASLNGGQSDISTPMYASSEFYAKRNRNAIDDMESLVFSMWYVAGVPVGQEFVNGEQPEGYVLCECKKTGKAEARMQKKCDQINNVIVRKAFQFVCINEILLSKRKIPKYNLITEVLTGAIGVMNRNVESKRFELTLEEAVKSSASSGSSKMFPNRR